MMIPENLPLQSRMTTQALLEKADIRAEVALVGVRGYFRDSMGEPYVNEVGMYDDAMFLISPRIYKSFNANVDPSSEKDGVANLCPGIWSFRIDTHGKSKPVEDQYDCLEQAEPVVVDRFNQGLDRGMFAIQIHRGGFNGTSSLGCQTIYPDQWDDFIASVKDELRAHNQHLLPYLLCDYQGGKAPV